jgi:hemoglobin-like flavoprotein
MTPEQVELIRKSFDALWPVRRKLADLFYNRFFELAPDARALFPQDIARQQLKPMDMIAAIVGALDKRDIFQSIIGYSGRQHAQIWSEASAFRGVWRSIDICPRTAVWCCIYPGAEASLECAPRRGAK